MRARECLVLSVFATVAAVGVMATAATPASAGVAWGDASLKGDDVRVEIDGAGRALVTHAIAIHVAARRFHAFHVDGVDEGAEAPSDAATAAGRDGPGWPLVASDANGGPVDAFAEPAREPRRLRIRLGRLGTDGVGRGDYAIHLRYIVDLARAGVIRRDGAMLRLAWGGVRWPEGYDKGRIVFVVPSAPTEPRVALAEGDGGLAGTEGGAIIALRRGATTDEVELTRPHVPHADDAQWLLRVDAKALPEVSAHLMRAEPPIAAPTTATARGWRWWGGVTMLAVAFGVVLGLALRRRDRDAARIACARVAGHCELRPLVAWSSTARAWAYAFSAVVSIVLTAAGLPLAAVVPLLAAMALAITRPPRQWQPTRHPGRWLATPGAALVTPARPTGAPLDPGSVAGALCAGSTVALTLGSAIALAPTHLAWSIAILVQALVVLPLFATGRAAQLPPDLASDAWPRLAPLARAVARIPGVSTRLIARIVRHPPGAHDAASTPSATSASVMPAMDEVRVRIQPPPRAALAGVTTMELGCAIVHGVGRAALIPQLLVRMRAGSDAARAIEKRVNVGAATFALTVGRSADERVLAIRPALTSAGSFRRWVTWVITQAEQAAAQTPPITL